MIAPVDLSSGQPLILQLLQQGGVLDSRKLETIREARTKDFGPLEPLLLKKGLASEREIAQAYATYLGLALLEGPNSLPPPDPALRRLLPEKLCRDQLIVPAALNGDVLDLI